MGQVEEAYCVIFFRDPVTLSGKRYLCHLRDLWRVRGSYTFIAVSEWEGVCLLAREALDELF